VCKLCEAGLPVTKVMQLAVRDSKNNQIIGYTFVKIKEEEKCLV
jgi:hypothetical protein